MNLRLLSVLLFTLLFINAIAQKERNFWYFGNQAGVDFSSGSPVGVTNGALYSSEGGTTVSDANGSLLFYTNGSTIWNKNHVPMANGTGLQGHESTSQSAVIVPKPCTPNIYYVFTLDQSGTANGLKYSEVDMTLNGGLGGVTSNKNISLFNPLTEKLTAVFQSNNKDFWVITHGFNNNTFLAYSVTSAGVNTTAVTSTGGAFNYSTGYLRANCDGTKFANAGAFQSGVDILSFNKTTGVFTFDYTIPCPLLPNVYGLEFSPDGSKLYIGGLFNPSVYQYDLSLSTPAAVISSSVVVGTSASLSDMVTLVLGPDKKIYFTNNNYLGCINNPNAAGLACGYADSVVDLLGKTAIINLPNFAHVFFEPPTLSYQDLCVNSPTNFSLSFCAPLDSVRWSFNDPSSGVNNTSTAINPSHTYTSIGTYTVSLISYFGCQSDTIFQPVTIVSPPVFSLGNDTALCSGVSLTLNPGAGFTSYTWQDASTNPTFSASSAGIYWVDVASICGTKRDSITITTLPNPTLSVAGNTICAGQAANLTASGASSYAWSAGITSTGVTTGTVVTGVSTSYTLSGIGANGCSANSSFTVTVNQPPTINAGIDTTISFGSTAQLNGTGGPSYNWSPSISLTCSNCSNPIANPTETTQYYLTVTDANNCMSIDSVTVFVDLPKVEIPNVFTPNGDGSNDVLKFSTAGLKTCQMDIYDRWGLKLFTTDKLNNFWDGSTTSGVRANEGTYFYVIVVTDNQDTKTEFKGHVTLLK